MRQHNQLLLRSRHLLRGTLQMLQMPLRNHLGTRELGWNDQDHAMGRPRLPEEGRQCPLHSFRDLRRLHGRCDCRRNRSVVQHGCGAIAECHWRWCGWTQGEQIDEVEGWGGGVVYTIAYLHILDLVTKENETGLVRNLGRQGFCLNSKHHRQVFQMYIYMNSTLRDHEPSLP